MERLFRVLSELQGEKYQGSYIGKAVWERNLRDLPADAEAALFVERETKKCMRIKVSLSHRNALAAQLQIMLFLAAESREDAMKPLVNRPVSANVWRSFSKAEVGDFAQSVGDDNPIHWTEHPVVPGLLLLRELQMAMPTASLLSVRFLRPLYANDSIYLQKDVDLWQGWGQAGLAFMVKIQYFADAGE